MENIEEKYSILIDKQMDGTGVGFKPVPKTNYFLLPVLNNRFKQCQIEL